LIDPEGNPSGYDILCEQMFRKEYYFFVNYDENRAEDGLHLRDVYLDSLRGGPGVVPQGPCSFLEFLIGVAIRLEEMLVDGEPIPVGDYFWELASRLRLTEYTNDMYGEESTQFVVDAIMTDLMDRNYDRCGSTGLFPLHPPCKDQRKVEVWYQLNSYLLQNQDFFME
jgi:hypothetical protein